MDSFIASFAVGIVCIVIGISNMKGKLSALHSYHRKRVYEENLLPFGKKVGLGMIIAGVTFSVYGIFSMIADFTVNPLFESIGNILRIVGLAVGLGICFHAMIKYNKGIF